MAKKKKKPDMRALRAAKISKNRLQVGALCYRYTDKGNLRILLITSRRTRRWIGPKGWPMRGKTNAQSAAQEALEEAGVLGKIKEKSIGLFHYPKRGTGRKSVDCAVLLYPMEVTDTLKNYREKGERSVKWLKPKNAINRADPPEFARLIRKFSQKAGASK